jgi:carbamoyl-phosphate synthase small subunit
MESERCHLSGIIIRDLSCTVSNYRSTKTLDQYLKEQNVLGTQPPCTSTRRIA